MATYTSPSIKTIQRAGATGNVAVARGAITGNGAGGTAVAGSVLNLVKLPRFCRIHNVTLIASATTASLTVTAGYAAVDGDTVGDALDADAFVVAATSLATVAPVQANNGAIIPVTPPKESFITVTTAGATILAGTTITAVVEYEYLGPN